MVLPLPILESQLPELDVSSLNFNFPLPVLQDLTHVQHKCICKFCSREIPVEKSLDQVDKSLDPLQEVYNFINKIIVDGKYPNISEITKQYNTYLSDPKYETHKRQFRRLHREFKLQNNESIPNQKFLSDIRTYLYQKIRHG